MLNLASQANKQICLERADAGERTRTEILKVEVTLEQATKAQGKVKVQLYSFFNLGARLGWVVNAATQTLYPRERPDTHCVGCWVGPRAGLNGCGKSRPHRDSIPEPPARSQSEILRPHMLIFCGLLGCDAVYFGK